MEKVRPQQEPTRREPRTRRPVVIPQTSPRAYIGGSGALNVPTLPGDRDRGDWHGGWAWWDTIPRQAGEPAHRIALWGPDGEIAGLPGTPELRDAREAMASVGHPSAQSGEPVYAATVVQATLDTAWDALREGYDPPDRRETSRWLSEAGEREARDRAKRAEARIEDQALRARWRAWRLEALEGDDPFYDTAPSPPADEEAAVRLNIEVVRG